MKGWLLDHIERDGRKLDAISSAAQISKSLASSWTIKGSGEPDELARLCREVGASVPEAFGIAGWLLPEEIEPQFPIPDIKRWEVDLVLAHRARKGTDQPTRRIVLELLGLPRELADEE